MLVSPYKAIIFDFDETLVRGMSVKWKQHQQAAKNFYNHDLTDETLRAHWGKPFEQLIDLLYEGKDTVENMIRNYHTLDVQFRKYPYKDSISVLNFLNDHSYWLGMVTSMTRDAVIGDMKKSGMPYEQFDLIQGSTDSLYHKPDPRVFDDILSKLGNISITPSQTLYVGDDMRDMQAAKGAGIHFIAIPNGLTMRDEFVRAGAICISSLSDLLGDSARTA